MAINSYSTASLLLNLSNHSAELGTATGFVVERNGKHYLITNFHVISGRRPDNGQPAAAHGGIPTKLGVNYFYYKEPQAVWRRINEPIYDGGGDPLWLEHPQHGRNVDVVALEIHNHNGAKLIPYALEYKKELMFSVANPLSIIGFPFGVSAGGLLGVWLKGSVASEPSIDFNDLPSFLIDARTRPGQSGSPVLSYYSGGFIPYETGGSLTLSAGGAAAELQGVYSGRISEESDLGIVWKRSVIAEIIDGAKRSGSVSNFGAIVN